MALAIHNLHVPISRNKGVKESDATGDGTGYSLTIKKNYVSYAQELKDKAKEEKGSDEDNSNSGNNGSNKSAIHKRRLFVYAFTIMDLATRLYLAYGSITKSERNVFDKAMVMLARMTLMLNP